MMRPSMYFWHKQMLVAMVSCSFRSLCHGSLQRTQAPLVDLRQQETQETSRWSFQEPPVSF